MLKNQKGFLLISIIFIMLLMAVSIFSINYYSTTQIRIASNHAGSIQTSYDLNAVSEHSLWKLMKNLFWRTDAAGEDTTFNGTIYERIALNANDDALFEDTVPPYTAPPSLDDYDDAVTVRVTPKGSDQPFQRSFRYYASELELSGYSLNHPERIFVMPTGELLIADKDNHRVIKVDPDTSVVTIIAGTGFRGNTDYSGTGESFVLGVDGYAVLDKPQGVCADSSGTDYYIADTDNHRILKVTWDDFDLGTYSVTRVVGQTDKPDYNATIIGRNAKINSPRGIYLDNDDSKLYFADKENHCIRMTVLSIDNNTTTVAGKGKIAGDEGDGGLATSALLEKPQGICLDNHGNLFIADTKNYKIRKVDADGYISKVAGTDVLGDTGDGGLATDARLKKPVDVSVDLNGNIFIVDSDSKRIRVVNALNGNIYTLAGTGLDGDTAGLPAVDAKFRKPAGIAMASSYGGNRIYISDKDNHKIKVLLLKTVYGL